MVTTQSNVISRLAIFGGMDVEPLSLPFYLGVLRLVHATEANRDSRCSSRASRFRARWKGKPGGYARQRPNNHNRSRGNRSRIQIFREYPGLVSRFFPAVRFSHTSEHGEFSSLSGKKVLIIGGRQSAFECTALIHEAGAEAVYVSYRHPTPKFTESDWTWVAGNVDSIAKQPGWFRRLSDEERNSINQRQWAEGRLKLEPWLEPRITNDKTKLFPESEVVACEELPNGSSR